MDTAIAAVGARFEAPGMQRLANFGRLRLGLLCASTGDSLEMAGDILALIHMTDESRVPTRA